MNATPRGPGPRPVALVGLPGSGKSTVAPLLGRRLGVTHVDLDALVADEAGASVPALFDSEGEARFRVRERAALDAALARGAGVIACGGGTTTETGTAERLAAACTVIWLDAADAVLLGRLANDNQMRPLLAGSPHRRLAVLRGQREAGLSRLGHRVDACGSADEVAARVVAALAAGRTG